MKIKLILLFLVVTSSALANPLSIESIRRDSHGFPTCYSNGQNVYFFIWDHFIHTSSKKVSFVELKDYTQATGHRLSGCDETQYQHSIADDILKSIVSETKDLFPDEIVFALNQVALGANEFTPERTAHEFIENHPSLFKLDSPQILSYLRHQVGDQKAYEIIQAWSQILFSNSDKSCDLLIGTCDFYLCQELKNPCGIDGYNLGFGYKYCSGSKFELLPQMPSALGRNWVQNVFKCLQQKNFSETLTSSAKNTCESSRQTSIDSHTNCYLEAGFCQLSNKERLLIFNLIKSQIFSTDTVKQGLRILQQCKIKDSL